MSGDRFAAAVLADEWCSSDEGEHVRGEPSASAAKISEPGSVTKASGATNPTPKARGRPRSEIKQPALKKRKRPYPQVGRQLLKVEPSDDPVENKFHTVF